MEMVLDWRKESWGMALCVMYYNLAEFWGLTNKGKMTKDKPAKDYLSTPSFIGETQLTLAL